MAGPFELERLWDDENFMVQKGVLRAKTTLYGAELGSGVIYSPGGGKLRHRMANHLVTRQSVVDEVGHDLTCLWNPGPFAEIINVSKEPTDLLQVRLNYGPDFVGELSADYVAAATAHLLHGTWPTSFRASVRKDVAAIGLLASPFLTGLSPGQETIRRASRAKEDLKFKLACFAAASRPWGTISYLQAYNFKLPWASPSTATGIVNVIVNTKDPVLLTDVSGCEVWTNAYGAEDDLTDAESFPRLSTPTKKPLAVGKYTMWSRRGNRTGASRAISVGSIDRPFEGEQTVDLLAP